MSFPRKEERLKCYESRDQFWQCLDKYYQDSFNNTTSEVKNIDIEIEDCKKFRQIFETNCPSQWVAHFNRKYSYLKFKEKMETGYDPIDEKS